MTEDTTLLDQELERNNKIAIITAMKTADISVVVAEYYGDNDSGGIEDITATKDGQIVPKAALDTPTPYRSLVSRWNEKPTVIQRELPLHEAILEFCTKVLYSRFSAWYDGDEGAEGTVTIRALPGAESVAIRHGERRINVVFEEYAV